MGTSYKIRTIGTALLVLLCRPSMTCGGQAMTSFSVSFDSSVSGEPLSGRILLLFSRTERFTTNENGTPFVGVDVDELKPGQHRTIDASAAGYPIRSIRDLPAGDYFVQAYLNVYTTFHRSDGKVIKLHNDQGEGQNWRRSPGNLYSEPQKISYDPGRHATISLVMSKKIPPVELPKDTEWVKTVRIQSELLSKFWGQPMFIGARVLVPKGFHERPDARYPVVYIQGHFSMANPGRFAADENNAFYKAWTAPDAPRMLLVTIQHANPYYDDSYGVNSENVGPYGDAITRELMPHVEKQFRAIGAPYARVLTGGSTGGWIALAMQVFYPDFFGGTWAFYPDQVDFRKYQIVNLYEDDNAYYIEHEWTRVPRPGRRNTDGNIVYTMEQENMREEVLGTRYRSGGQWAIWNAVFAPTAEDGFPKPLWDPLSGKIDRDTALWAQERYDLRHYLEKNWATVGPMLAGKINVFCGRMDNYYLNEAVYLLEEFLAKTENPHYAGRFEYGDRGGHGWSPFGRDSVELYKEMAEHIAKNAPGERGVVSWKYR